MSINERTSLISVLEGEFSTKIIAYLTGDRQGMPAQIGADAIPRFRRHLESIGEVESIGLFLFSRGGDTNVPWRLVNLIREYCHTFIVLVPYRAHSAGTLLSLGADKIYMGKMSELSSVDPRVANPFNPPDPSNPLAKVPISVEDVNAYRDLARRFGVKEQDAASNAQVFMALASKVDPLALGNVERSYNQIRKLAEDLLRLHMDENAENQVNISKIVDTMTQKLYSHEHLINRKEAKRIGLKVESVTKTKDELLWKLFSDYSNEMELDKAFSPPRQLGSEPAAPLELKRAFIESFSMTDCFVSKGQILRFGPGTAQIQMGLPPSLAQPQSPVAVQIDYEEWQVVR